MRPRFDRRGPGRTQILRGDNGSAIINESQISVGRSSSRHGGPPRVQRKLTRTGSHRSRRSGRGHPVHLDDQKVFIATMGATGSGKSSFINLVSGSRFRVGKGLRSATSVAQATRSFELDGCRVVLIDMPGFDDTTRSDIDILKVIADFLKTSYKKGRLLSGILYFHRISDVRMSGAAMRNLNMFKWLCGKSFLQNVVIVTNMWGDVSPRVGNAREAELRNDDLFFRRILRNGAQMARHLNTMRSAEDIIRLALGNRPRPLRIQRELVDEGLDISHTSAGEELNREINAQIRKYQGEILMLEEEMQEAYRDQDDEARREIKAEARKLQKQMEKAEDDVEKLESNYGSCWKLNFPCF